MKVVSFSQDSGERKYLVLDCEYKKGSTTKIILKEMQEVEIRLTAKEGFPIDYMIRLVFPHPEVIGETVTYN